MNRQELGIFEDDPRSVAGAEALALLNAASEPNRTASIWKPDYRGGLWADDPRVTQALAEMDYRNSKEGWMERKGFSMDAGIEYSPIEQ